MKKIFALIIACLYLAVSSGLAVQIHHCMGDVSGITLVPSAEDECGNCGMEKGDNKCCKDELKFVKLQDSYKLTHADYRIPVAQDALSISSLCPDNTLYFTRHSPTALTSHSPPGYPPVPLCIMNCIFRI